MANYTNDQIVEYAKRQGYVDQSGNISEAGAQGLYRDAAAHNVTASQLDSAFKLDPGRAESYIESKGWNPLKGSLPSWMKSASSFTSALQAAAGPTKGPTSMKVSDNMLASNQLSKILAQDSPLMQRVRGQAMDFANSRGLMNSSIAAEAGEAAMIDGATPLAQSNAQTYFNVGAANMQAQNDFAKQANELNSKNALAGMSALTEMARDRFNIEAQIDRDTANREFEAAENQRQRDFSLSRDDRQNAFTAGQNLEQRTWQGEQNRMQRDAQRDQSDRDAAIRMTDLYTGAVTRINTDPSMTDEQKREAINNLGDYFYNQAMPAFKAGYFDPASWPRIEATNTSAGIKPNTVNTGRGGSSYDQSNDWRYVSPGGDAGGDGGE